MALLGGWAIARIAARVGPPLSLNYNPLWPRKAVGRLCVCVRVCVYAGMWGRPWRELL